jgi:DNA-binding response OmpR family regulator
LSVWTACNIQHTEPTYYQKELLELLLERAQKVWTNDTLEQHAHGQDENFENNVLSQLTDKRNKMEKTKIQTGERPIWNYIY